jgi:hypothetical protein
MIQSTMCGLPPRVLLRKKPSMLGFIPSSKIANKLDWNKGSGCVLSMSIAKQRIDLAVASHPSCQEPVESLSSIPLKTVMCQSSNRKLLCETVKQELSAILSDYPVCGMLVAWPVQRDSGRCGAPCGRVLHTLDQIMPAITTSPAICLYDASARVPDEDAWGRAVAYGRIPDNATTVHVASKEQYYHYTANKTTVCVDLWSDFSRLHWPELAVYNDDAEEMSTATVRTTSRRRMATTPLSGQKPATIFHPPPWLLDDEDTDAASCNF